MIYDVMARTADGLVSLRRIPAAVDDTAIIIAQRKPLHFGTVEIWQGARFVGSLTREETGDEARFEPAPKERQGAAG